MITIRGHIQSFLREKSVTSTNKKKGVAKFHRQYISARQDNDESLNKGRQGMGERRLSSRGTFGSPGFLRFQSG